MKIIVLAERFQENTWTYWEHHCNEEEIDAVIDSANAKAADHMHVRPAYIDYLKGAAYVFNVAYGRQENPRDGDTRVYAVVVDETLIGNCNKIERYFLVKNTLT